MTTHAARAHCCHPTTEVHNEPHFLEKHVPLSIVEKVFRIALAVFAVSVSPVLFTGAFLCGAVWAAVDPTLTKKTADQWGSYICSQGFIEQLSGMKIPAPLGVLADFAVKYVHIEHHPGVFAPLTGLGVGLWAGSMLRESMVGAKS